MVNISGNFNTTDKEIQSVKDILTIENIDFKRVTKNPNADDGDILVELSNGKTILIEVKEESFERFSKYGDLGIDFISAFYLKPNAPNWKGSPKSPILLEKFLNDIDRTKPYKDGKLFYSKADLWLFFVKDGDDYSYYCFLDGQKSTSDEFKNYLYNNCKFSVNNKPYWQLSNRDIHNSAVFFINHKNTFLNSLMVNLNDYINK